MKPVPEVYYKELAKKIKWKSGKPYWKTEVGCKTKKGQLAGTICEGYRIVGITINRCSKLIKAHKLRWYMKHRYIPKELDHIDQDKDNNRILNLRSVSHMENTFNRTKRKGTSSEYVGVCWDKTKGKWHAKIMFNGVSIHLGYFNDEEEAARARDKKAKELHGEFASLNFK